MTTRRSDNDNDHDHDTTHQTITNWHWHHYLQMAVPKRNKSCSLCCCCTPQTNSDYAIFEETTENEDKESQPNIEAAFVGPLPNPLLTGHVVTVTGDVFPECTRFSINLKCGFSSQSEIAFHLDLRLVENYTVRNSLLGGRWGTEETTTFRRLALSGKKSFKVSVFMGPDSFYVSLDDHHLCNFKYRVPLVKVEALTVNGDVTVTSVRNSEASEYPDHGVVPEVPIVEPVHEEQFNNYYIGRLTEGLEQYDQIEICGRVRLLPHSFYINLQDGVQIWPHPNVPLHINPRFYSGVNSVIRNAWLNGNWGPEERMETSKFRPGHKFHLIIRKEAEEYSVWMNNQMTGVFKFRTNYSQTNTVLIQGDVVIHKVWLNSNVQNILLNMKQ